MKVPIQKIVLIGGESTGKTTLANNLAKHFNTCFVSEYAREFLFKNKGNFSYTDMLEIAKIQLTHENRAILKSNKYLFCDTNVLTTVIWSLYYFNQYNKELDFLLENNSYDYYLVLSPDIPWKNDSVRSHPTLGNDFYKMIITELNNRNIRYTTIHGTGVKRIKNAISAIENSIIDF